MLPTKLLSTTSAVCELYYGEERRGELVAKILDSRDETVHKTKPFKYENREALIYKKTDRDEAFNHTVKLWVPLKLLKVGRNVMFT